MLLVVCEALFVVVGLAGVGLWSVPAALVIGGVLGVLAVERAQATRTAAQEERNGKEMRPR